MCTAFYRGPIWSQKSPFIGPHFHVPHGHQIAPGGLVIACTLHIRTYDGPVSAISTLAVSVYSLWCVGYVTFVIYELLTSRRKSHL